MKPYLIALAVGVLVGVIYGLLNVRSPAPPYIALLGLLGMLLGEQGVSLVKGWIKPPDPPAAHIQPTTPDDRP